MRMVLLVWSGGVSFMVGVSGPDAAGGAAGGGSAAPAGEGSVQGADEAAHRAI